MVLHETSVLPDHAQEETLHIKVMESELRRLKNEVNTLLNDLKQTETLTEELTDRCRAAEETKEHIAGKICVLVFCYVNFLSFTGQLRLNERVLQSSLSALSNFTCFCNFI